MRHHRRRGRAPKAQVKSSAVGTRIEARGVRINVPFPTGEGAVPLPEIFFDS